MSETDQMGEHDEQDEMGEQEEQPGSGVLPVEDIEGAPAADDAVELGQDQYRQ